MLTLEAKKRTTENPATIREGGFIPGIYYGAGKEAASLMVSAIPFAKVFREAGETSAVTLDFGTEKVSTLIHDVQFDPVTNMPIHVDFLVVDMNKEIEVPVTLEFVGVAEAEKLGLGTLVKVIREVHIRALPGDLPHALQVDVSVLKTLEDKVHVSDLVLPKGVTCVTPGEEVVALVTAFVEEKEEAPVDLSAIEVEKKGKKEDESADTTA
ncbi:MAG TPA: 50S ribosomal protein L25 [Candidatus Paceibacterota bacterium]|nr:50S ribosomal protein L25 [Candidatus Paceibacterota bacterium]